MGTRPIPTEFYEFNTSPSMRRNVSRTALQSFNPQQQPFNPQHQPFNPQQQPFNPQQQPFNPQQQPFNPQQPPVSDSNNEQTPRPTNRIGVLQRRLWSVVLRVFVFVCGQMLLSKLSDRFLHGQTFFSFILRRVGFYAIQKKYKSIGINLLKFALTWNWIWLGPQSPALATSYHDLATVLLAEGNVLQSWNYIDQLSQLRYQTFHRFWRYW